MTTKAYTTQLGAGLGMVDETRLLLDLWQEGMSGTDLYRTALASGHFSTISARRLHDLITVGFAPRYLINQGIPANLLKTLKDELARREFEQLLFIYTCRAHAILADFVRDVYWGAYTASREVLSNEEAQAFVISAIRNGKTTTPWSNHMVSRVASYLTGCCADFGLLERGRKSVRKILPYRIEPRIAAILAYDLHFAGSGDNQVVNDPEWALFGLDPTDVLNELKQLALKSFLIIQAAGGVVRISWPYKTREELAHVLAHGEL
jgi:hypothetical protein